jgi:hypothetical protein
MKYSLRSLMIVVLVLPPLIAGTWLAFKYLNESRQPKTIPPEWIDFNDVR